MSVYLKEGLSSTADRHCFADECQTLLSGDGPTCAGPFATAAAAVRGLLQNLHPVRHHNEETI